MEKFDISYRIEGDETRSLVAQLVPLQRPSLAWQQTSEPPAGIRTLTLLCRMSEPAPGLIQWLTVCHHRDSTDVYWRRGVFLRHRIAACGSEALLELRGSTELAVQVRAPSPDLYFNVLRDSIEDLITRRWPGLGYRLHIPCPGTNADGSPCTGVFPLDGPDAQARLLSVMTTSDTAWNGSWNVSPDNPAQPVPSVRFPVLSVQLARSGARWRPYGKEKVCSPSGSSRWQQPHRPQASVIIRRRRFDLLG
jgi:hypothetical protein